MFQLPREWPGYIAQAGTILGGTYYVDGKIVKKQGRVRDHLLVLFIWLYALSHQAYTAPFYKSDIEEKVNNDLFSMWQNL